MHLKGILTQFFHLSSSSVTPSLCSVKSDYLNLHNPGEGSLGSTGSISDVERVAGRLVYNLVLISTLWLLVTLHRGVLLGESISATIGASSDSGLLLLVVRSPHSPPQHGGGEEGGLVSV